MTDNNKNFAVEKLKLESEKIKCEIRELEKPFYTRPSFWISTATAIFAIFGMLGQYTVYTIRSEKADLNVEKAEKRIKIAKTVEKESELKNKELLKNKAQLESEVVSIKDKLQKAKLALQDTNRRIQEIENDVTAEQRERLEAVSYAIDTAQEAIPKSRQVAIARATVDQMIPDNDINGISSIIDLKQNGKVKSLDIRIDIEHTFIGDLRIELESSSRKKIILFDRTGGATNDLHRWFDISSCPALKDLKDDEIRGQWTLCVKDLSHLDIGRFISWGIEVKKESFDVVLNSYGTSKIQAIKAIRKATGVGLKKAKELVDSVPIEIKQDTSEQEAILLKQLLEPLGASVEIKPNVKY